MCEFNVGVLIERYTSICHPILISNLGLIVMALNYLFWQSETLEFNACFHYCAMKYSLAASEISRVC
jgi:hypothetical protein